MSAIQFPALTTPEQRRNETTTCQSVSRASLRSVAKRRRHWLPTPTAGKDLPKRVCVGSRMLFLLDKKSDERTVAAIGQDQNSEDPSIIMLGQTNLLDNVVS